jgi:dimethylhistidine N-methyltransferase
MRNLALNVADIGRYDSLADRAAQGTADEASPAADGASEGGGFAEAMRLALVSRPRRIAPKFFYDEAGSELFERIGRLDEYLTRTECAILRQHAAPIARLIGAGAELVEFGAGNLSKVRILLDALVRPARYVPVDLSVAHLQAATQALARSYPGLPIAAWVHDFSRPLAGAAPPAAAGRRAGLFLGSTIGNLSERQAMDFLADAAVLFQGSGLLVGVDLVKDPAVLHRAYNDASGTTAAFNLNLLARANRELGSDFDLGAFEHYAYYEPGAQSIRMHLVSQRRQAVQLGGRTYGFEQGESLHTEDSRKYTIDGFRDLARRAGLAPGPVWCDARQLFSVHWLAAPARAARVSASVR